MKALPCFMSLQQAFSLGTGRGLLVTFRTENCTVCFFWVSTAPAKYLEKLSVVQQPSLLGWEFPRGGIVYWGIDNSVLRSRGSFLAGSGLDFPSRVSVIFRVEGAIFGSTLSFFQRRKNWSREAERFIGSHQQLTAGLGHVLTCPDAFH